MNPRTTPSPFGGWGGGIAQHHFLKSFVPLPPLCKTDLPANGGVRSCALTGTICRQAGSYKQKSNFKSGPLTRA